MQFPSPYATLLAGIPVREHRASVGGADAAWWEYGPSDARHAIIAVHGFRGDHHGLEPIVAQLPSARFIMPDLPGYGESGALPGEHSVSAYANWLTEFVRAVQDQGSETILLGHSFGSIIVAAALDHGLEASRVILINPIAAPALAGPKALLSFITLGYYRAANALPARVGNWMLSNRLMVRFMSIAMVKTRDRALRGWIHQEHDRYFSNYASRESVVEGFSASISDNVIAHAKAFTGPTLLIGAAKDQITSRADLEALHRAIGGSELKVIAGVGHLIHYETPDIAASAICKFLELEPSRTSRG